MRSTIGRPRTLTDRQVKIILAWHARFLVWRALRKTLKSQRQLARELGVSQARSAMSFRLGGRLQAGFTRAPRDGDQAPATQARAVATKRAPVTLTAGPGQAAPENLPGKRTGGLAVFAQRITPFSPSMASREARSRPQGAGADAH